MHMATRRRGTPSNINCVVQGEAMTPGTDTAILASNNAAFSGAGQNGMRISGWTTNTMVPVRLSDTFPANGLSNTDNRGEYLVYARVAKTVAGDVFNTQLKYGASSSNTIANDVQVTPAGQAGPFFLNMGKVPVPMGPDPMTHGFSGVESKAAMAFIGFYAQRVSGTGNLDIDYLYFIPCDDQTLIVKFPSTDIQYAVDGTTDSGGAVYGFPYPAMDEVLTTATFPQVIGGGGFPEIIPGVTNRIYFLRNIDPNGTVDGVTNTTVIRAFYWPRWREAIRP
jgi:hypothetical protein